MKLFITLILSVSVTGTVPFCIYLLLKKIIEPHISAVFQFRLLKFFFLCFLIPFSLLTNLIAPQSIVFDKYIYLENHIVQFSDGLQLRPGGELYKILIPVWLSVLVILIFCQLRRYIHFHRYVLPQLKPDTIHQEEFDRLKKQLGIPGHISLLYYDDDTSPFTCGFLHPCVVVTSSVPENTISMAMHHELQHIKSRDFLFHAAAFLIFLIHCWNPVMHLLWKEYCDVQEMACDEKVTAGLSSREVRLYGCSLIDLSSAAVCTVSFSSHFSHGSKNSIRRRIIRLSRHFHKKRLLPGVFLLILCLTGFSITAFTCSPEIIDLPYLSEEFSNTDWVIMEFAENNVPICPEDELYFQYTDCYFLLEDGKILDASPNDSPSAKARASCVHTWKKATLKSHQRNSKGGCTVTTYTLNICTKCNATKDKTLLTELYYAICPHS